MRDLNGKTDEAHRDLAADLAICDAATPGPWRAGTIRENIVDPDGRFLAEVALRDVEANVTFIAEAREGWPEAIRRAQAAEAEVERLKAELAAEEDRRCAFEMLADSLAQENERLRAVEKRWAQLREVVVTNATGDSGENINDYDIMLNVMDELESEVCEDATDTEDV